MTGVEEGLYPFIETYIALVAYYVLHMIYVIAGDFIEAFSIPPLNIGIYIDKLASIRALMMTVADIVEIAAQKIHEDVGNMKTLFDSGAKRRHGSLFSFLSMLVCRIAYLWLVYYSNNKSLDVFITLTVEGFWFGFFQMGFFAIGPEYNAFTSFALHLTGNFVFFFQIILNKMAASRPKITCTYRVRIHAWIAFVSTFIALVPWIYFCSQYVEGDTDKFKELVEAVATKVGEKIKAKLGGGTLNDTKVKEAISDTTVKKKVKALIESEKDFGLTDVTTGGAGDGILKVTTNGGQTYSVNVTAADNKVTVTITSTTGALGTEAVTVTNPKSDAQAKRIVYTVQKALTRIKKVAISVTSSSGSVIVKINHGEKEELVTTLNGGTGTITVEVDGWASPKVKDWIRDKLKEVLSGTVTGSPTGTVTIEKEDSAQITGDGKSEKTNSLSPMLLFPVGSVIKDFMYPGILPFAFLDPERANLVNYTMPVFYMTGAVFVVLVNDVFTTQGILALGSSLDSEFKAWSEGAEQGLYYHGFWLLNLVMLATLVVALFSIHGIYPWLRCLVQCRWRVMLMTLAVLIPRSHLEIMGYVGVANYAILASHIGDFKGFDMITVHDVLAMFCRFANGKLAVGFK